MLKKKSLWLVMLLLAASCSNNDVKRNVSSDDRSDEEAAKDYWKNRGAGWSKFEYDGYNGKKLDGKFRKALTGKGNLGYTSELSSRRQQLFEENLFDTGVTANAEIDCSQVMKRVHRTAQGECYFHGNEEHLTDRDKKLANQLRIGAFNERFGRNMKADPTNEALDKDLMDPSPLEISKRLLARDGKQTDAPVINVLATAWLQAMNHDWFTHGKNSKKKHYKVGAHKSHPDFKDGMTIPATREETEGEKSTENPHGYEKNFRNQVTHWWDASQIYGSDAETIRKVRSVWRNGQNTGKLIPNGKIAVDVANRKLRYDSQGLPVTGFHDNWWTGLELIHVLFHLEHNHIVNHVLLPQVKKKKLCYEGGRKVAQAECDEILFEKARMINSALIAKIHTVEWTPALLDNQMLHVGMRSNWFGMKEVFMGLSLPFIRKHVNGSLKHLLSGLTGKHTLDLYSVPFTLTEEFVAVYRMHPLVPDSVTVRSSETSAVKEKVSTKDMIFRQAKSTMSKHGSADWLYSFGTSFPGAMTLHNYPTWMSKFTAERNTGKGHGDSVVMDMGAVDIFRDRERGILKYNEFRRQLHLPAIKNFAELTPNKEDQKALEDIYGDIENVDLLIGTLAEADRYPGYAFGNTPFYIFALMASRRLMADPFFSDYFTKEYYTKGGIDHVNKRDMSDVIISHFPEFKKRFYVWKKKKIGRGHKAVQVVKNAFRPWLPVYNDVKKAIQPMDGL